MNFIKLVKQTDGVWAEQPATVTDIIDPTVLLGNSSGNMARAIAYGLIVALLVR